MKCKYKKKNYWVVILVKMCVHIRCEKQSNAYTCTSYAHTYFLFPSITILHRRALFKVFFLAFFLIVFFYIFFMFVYLPVCITVLCWYNSHYSILYVHNIQVDIRLGIVYVYICDTRNVFGSDDVFCKSIFFFCCTSSYTYTYLHTCIPNMFICAVPPSHTFTIPHQLFLLCTRFCFLRAHSYHPYTHSYISYIYICIDTGELENVYRWKME